MKWVTNILAAIGAILTITGFYELAFKSRHVPYIVTYIHICGDKDSTAGKVREITELAYANIGGTIFLDIDFVYNCENEAIYDQEVKFEDDSGISVTDNNQVITLTAMPQKERIPDVSLRMTRDHFAALPLSRIQQGITETSGDRILGLFFLRGNLEAGLYDVDLYPVPYSDDLQAKFSCSKSLGNQKTLIGKAHAYVKSCILGIEQPDWATRDE